jgi:DNA polymerase-1
LATQLRAFDNNIPQDPLKTIVDTGEKFEAMLRELAAAPRYAIDTETSGVAWFKHARVCGLGFGVPLEGGGVRAWYVPVRHQNLGRQLSMKSIQPAIKKLVENPKRRRIAHNMKFDAHILRRENIIIQGPVYCTMVAARIANENDLAGLKHRAMTDLGEVDAGKWESHLKYQISLLARAYGCTATAYTNRFGYSQIPINLCGYYACFDIDYTLRLHDLYEYKMRLSERFRRVMNIEMNLVTVLTDMEERGQAVDVEYLESLRDSLLNKLDDLADDVWREFPDAQKFQLQNDNQLRHFMLNVLRLPLFERTKSGDQFSVARNVLEHFSEDVPGLMAISSWRDANKISTTYTNSILTKLDVKDVVHCEFNQNGAATGRMSSKVPNMQNIGNDSDKRAKLYSGKSLKEGGKDPWSIRRAFHIPQKGFGRLYIDYSQVELRVMAFRTQDPILMDSYLKDEDVHTRTSMEVFGTADMRRIAKIINFGNAYGMSPQGLARQARISEEKAQEFHAAYFKRYFRIAEFREEFWKKLRRENGFFTNLWQRPRRVPAINSRDPKERSSAQRRAFGSLIQGEASELTKESLVRIHQFLQRRKSECYLSSTIHDEIQIDGPLVELRTIAPLIARLMCAYPEFAPIPIKAEIKYTITNWADYEDFDPKKLEKVVRYDEAEGSTDGIAQHDRATGEPAVL